MIAGLVEMRYTAQKGRGMFACNNIESGTAVERAPVIVMDAQDRELLEQTRLNNYIFEWGEDAKSCCMALGYVAIYNHSYESNCEYEMDFEKRIITVKAVRNILKDEELTINYNGDWNATRKVWFEVK